MKYELQAFQFALNMFKGSLNFARAPFKLKKTIKLEEIKGKKLK
jgi:hypothetical protein